MTNTEAANSKDYRRSPEANAKRMSLSPAQRKELYAADRAGDWATVARIMGEDVGLD